MVALVPFITSAHKDGQQKHTHEGWTHWKPHRHIAEKYCDLDGALKTGPDKGLCALGLPELQPNGLKP